MCFVFFASLILVNFHCKSLLFQLCFGRHSLYFTAFYCRASPAPASAAGKRGAITAFAQFSLSLAESVAGVSVPTLTPWRTLQFGPSPRPSGSLPNWVLCLSLLLFFSFFFVWVSAMDAIQCKVRRRTKQHSQLTVCSYAVQHPAHHAQLTSIASTFPKCVKWRRSNTTLVLPICIDNHVEFKGKLAKSHTYPDIFFCKKRNLCTLSLLTMA